MSLYLLLLYWVALLLSLFVAGCLLGALFSPRLRRKIKRIEDRFLRRDLSLMRLPHNPLIRPGKHYWQSQAVCNPGALQLDGRTHLVYRSVGSDGVSRLAYASSRDGVVIDDHFPYPIYAALNPSTNIKERRYDPVLYPSGGSWGGCEDPRVVAIDNRVFVTFNMFDDWDLRVGCISMPQEDFLAKRFNRWEGPITLSRGRAKNWVLFPEKINGQYAVLHSIIGEDASRVRIEYIDDLADLRLRRFESPDPQQVPDTQIAWHVHTRSAGPPPLKTEKGWLVFYHAHDRHEGHRYKLGAMLLDLNDPTRVIYRSAYPILEPDSHYENDGKPGIVYACGATIKDAVLHVYYGGADRVVCAAVAPVAAFLQALTSHEHAVLTPEPRVQYA